MSKSSSIADEISDVCTKNKLRAVADVNKITR